MPGLPARLSELAALHQTAIDLAGFHDLPVGQGTTSKVVLLEQPPSQTTSSKDVHTDAAYSAG
jgi:hypothetical protein